MSKKKQTSIKLEDISHNDLLMHKRARELAERYHVSLYHELETQRTLNHDQILEALRTVKPIRIDLDDWSRAVDYKYTMMPISAAGSIKRIGGRLNFGEGINSSLRPFHALYVASNNSTALSEKFQIDKSADTLSFLDFALLTEASYSVVKLKGKVSNIFNLDRANNTKKFIEIISTFSISSATNKLARHAKVNPWRVVKSHQDILRMCYLKGWAIFPNLYNIPSPSQSIGQIIRDAGFSGIIYTSTKSKGKCLALFPDRLSDDTYVELATKPKRKVKATRLDAKNYKEFI